LDEPRAKAVRYDATRRQIIVELSNGCNFIFPAEMGQGLANATNEELADVQVLGKCFGLHWENLMLICALRRFYWVSLAVSHGCRNWHDVAAHQRRMRRAELDVLASIH
jgi:Protein of unknown function (DUF2442)